MGEGLDIFGVVFFSAVAIVIVVRGIRRGDDPKQIRLRACFALLFALVALRGLLPVHSWRVSGLYIAGLLALGVTALWKGRVKR